MINREFEREIMKVEKITMILWSITWTLWHIFLENFHFWLFSRFCTVCSCLQGSYCQCHYCKCEKGHVHCKGHGHGGGGYGKLVGREEQKKLFEVFCRWFIDVMSIEICWGCNKHRDRRTKYYVEWFRFRRTGLWKNNVTKWSTFS